MDTNSKADAGKEAKDEKPQAQAAKSSTIVDARRVGSGDGMSLVEWHDGKALRRGWVKPDMISDDEGTNVKVDRPERSVPYGDDLSALSKFKLNPDDLTEALHERGVWTYADVQENPQVVLGALQHVYGMNLSSVLLSAGKASKAAETAKEND